MAQKVKLLDRVFPWLLILVVLVSCLPVLPVAAASSYDVVGEWLFDEELSVPPFSSLVTQIGDEISFEANDVTYVDIVYSNGFLSYELENGNLVNVYDYNTGWIYDTVRTVYFHTATSDFDDAAYSWFARNAIQLADDSSNEYMLTTIVIGDQTFDFSAPIDPPVVTMSITSQAATFTYGSRSFTWLNDNTTQTFLGFGMKEDDTEPVFSVGDTISLPTSPASNMLYTFYPLYSDSGGVVSSVLTAGEWECNSLVMTGEYVDLTAWPDGLSSVNLSFQSGGQSFTSMKYQYNVASGYRILYDSVYAYNYDTLSTSPAPAWQSDSFAKVYFSVDQTVPQAFYAWFTANFTRTGDDVTPSAYKTTVNIYDALGVNVLHTFTVSGDVAPVVSLNVNDTGCTLSYQDQSTSWSAGNSPFYGLALSSGSSGPYYKPGFTYSLPGGGSSDVTINLYVSESESSAGEASNVISGFVSTLINPVMAFFNVEFIPGFSFGKIALVAFLVGLVFWFLRMSK